MIKIVICDLDNTLYDWVSYFVPSFYAMVDEVEKITGLSREHILSDFRDVHVEYGDSEHPFSLLETRFVDKILPNHSKEYRKKYFDSAFHQFNLTRKKTLKLYDGVEETLAALIDNDIKIVAYTEANLFAAVDRISKLKIENKFSKVYCKQRSVSTLAGYREKNLKWASEFPINKVFELDPHTRKPNQRVLQQICEDEETSTDQAIYVGDSLTRDIYMAKNCNIFSAWAKYGTNFLKSDYEKLVKISHWSTEDVEREIKLKKEAANVMPDLILKESFSEILQATQITK